MTWSSRLLSTWLILPLFSGIVGNGPGCQKDKGSESVSTTASTFDFSRPSSVFTLPADLREISGLAAASDTSILAVQDEVGIVFSIDPRDGRVSSRTRFTKSGDFEGIAIQDSSVLVLESNGRINVIDGLGQPDQLVRRIRSPLRKDNDTEGIVLDPSSGDILVACKEKPGRGLEEGRAVHRFQRSGDDLEAGDAVLLPFRHFATKYNARKFKPSGIAVHPTSGEWYVLSSVLKAIAIIKDERIVEVVALTHEGMNQPEGISFLPDGRLAIANEGGKGNANLMIFESETTK